MAGAVAAAAITLLLLVGAAGCGDGDTAVSGPGTTPTQPAHGQGDAQPISPEPGVGQAVRSRPFDRAEISEDGAAVDILFYGGVQECYVVDRIEVDRSEPAVIEVMLFEGARPGAEVCIDIAVAYVASVALDPPAAPGSAVVDGTDGQVKS